MKKVRPILSIILVFMVILSSTGFTLNAHFCAGNIKTIGALSITGKCDMHETEKVPGCHKTDERNTEDDCCEEKAFEAETIDTNATNFVVVFKIFPVLYILYELGTIDLLNFSFDGNFFISRHTGCLPYKPSEIHILYQSFLI